MFVLKGLSDNRTIPGSRLVFERGNSELLVGPSYRARSLCKKVNYGCRHCLLVPRDDTLRVALLEIQGPRLMTFHGLRSHVKEK